MDASTSLRVATALLCVWLNTRALAAENIDDAAAETANDIYADAVAHYTDGRWELAEREFSRFSERYPDHAQAGLALFFRAEALVQLDRGDEARAIYSKFAAQMPEHRFAAQARFRHAELLYLAGASGEARQALERLLIDQPDDELAAYASKYLGELALASQDGQRAVEQFKRALERDLPASVADESRFGLGRAWELVGNTEAACEAYRTVATGDGPLADDARVQAAVCLYNHGKYEPAAAEFRTAIQRFSASELLPHARYWLGMCLAAQNQWSRAVEAFQDALDRHPDHPLAPAMTFWLADTLRQDGNLIAAQIGYAKVLQDWPDSEWADDSLQMRVQLALAQTQYERVIALGEQFRARFPDSPLLNHVAECLGQAYLKTKQYAAAIAMLEPLAKTGDAAGARGDGERGENAKADDGDNVGGQAATPVDAAPAEGAPAEGAATAAAEAPTAPRTNLYFLGLAYLGEQRYDEALTALAKVGATSKDPELQSGVRLARVMALSALERIGEAVELLQQHLESQPDGPEADACRVQLIELLPRADRWDEALRLIAQTPPARLHQPSFAAAVHHSAEAALRAGKNTDAVTLFGILIQDGQPEEWAVKGWSGLGWAQLRADKAAAAAVAFGRLVERYPDHPLAAEAAMMKAKASEQLERVDEAFEAYLLVATTYGDSQYAAVAMLAAARIDKARGRTVEAIPLLRRLIQEHPDFEQADAAAYQLAWALDEQGQADEADELFERIAVRYPLSAYWADSTYRVAERALRAERYERAAHFADRLIEAKCDGEFLAPTLYLRGQVAMATRHWPEVAPPLKALLEQFPDSPVRNAAQCCIAESLYQQKDYDAAAQWLTKLDSAKFEKDDPWAAMILLRRSQILVEQQKWEDARDLAARLEQQFPDFDQQDETNYVIGLCLFKLGEREAALERLERVSRSSEDGQTEASAKARWLVNEIHSVAAATAAQTEQPNTKPAASTPENAMPAGEAARPAPVVTAAEPAATTFRIVGATPNAAAPTASRTPPATRFAPSRVAAAGLQGAAPAPRDIGSAPRAVAPAPRVDASPLRASPSAPRVASPPPRPISSQPRLTSSAPKVASPAPKIAAQPPRIAAPASRGVAPPARIATPVSRPATPIARVASSAARATPAPRIAAPMPKAVRPAVTSSPSPSRDAAPVATRHGVSPAKSSASSPAVESHSPIAAEVEATPMDAALSGRRRTLSER